MRGGGSERQTLLLLQHLDRTRFEPHLYLIDRVGDLLEAVPADVTVHSYTDQPAGRGWYFPGRIHRRQIQHLRAVIHRHEIAVVYDRTFLMTLIAGPATRSLGVPRVSTIVSPPQLALPLVEKRFVRLKRQRLARAYRESHSVIAVSRQAADSASHFYGLEKSKLSVIHNPVDSEAIRAAAANDRPARDDRLTLVCVARMTAEKGHHDLLSAIELARLRWPGDLRPPRLWLVGDGPLRQSLQQRVDDDPNGSAVDFLGGRSNPLPAIAAADALVLPSRFEGLPNVVLEAMALGTPVIATRAGGTVELQREEPTALWAEPADPPSLSQAILEFAANRSAAIDRAQAANRLVAEHHEVRKTVATIEQHLESAAMSRARRCRADRK